ncbi:double C2-like domain-containing beta isoform X1 [Paramuricea clavata]|uniref:Double C2-like domain-containing beta isoform X1 n=1 Tax=Paramuricea clavata TaxID=317549 RepID=A0A7D9I701_PARCT|nr:double C2-like domain-containing beta isoform X1 [Paramuricea clavata]
MEADEKLLVEDPWVCPNDRELGLRAKLDSGWSFYTNRQQTGKKLLIKEDEIGTIEAIIKKAEEVTLREEYRIGRLVDRLENIKNNAQGNGITTCLLCDEKFGKITATPIKCSICEKAACGKCGVDTMSSGNVPIFLCKLCNEQREFWKKSGAWFFRQLPKHELPSARERHYMASGSFIVSTPELKNKKGNLLSQASEMYSDSDVESDVSSEADDHTRRRAAYRKSQASVSQHETYQHDDENDGHKAGVDDYSSRHSSVLSLDDDRLSRSETPSPSLSNQRGSQHSGHDVSEDESESRNSMILRRSPLMVRKKKRPSNGSVDRRGSGVSWSSDIVSEQNTSHASGNENTEDELYAVDGARGELRGPLGVIEFTVNFIKDARRLDVHIHNAKGLRAMDSNGLSDPYVKVHLLPGANKGNKTRTRTQHKTLNPMFNETLTYHGVTEDDMKSKTLRLQVLDEDKLRRNDFIGETVVPLKSILITNNKKMQKILEPKSETGMDTPSRDDGLGRIYMSLCFVSKESKLVVGILRCCSLVAMDLNGYSDPYVKCYLLPDPNRKTKRRTKVKKRNLNPEFNEHFSYKIAHHELANRTLEVTVWDHDVGKSNDFIGGVHLGIHAKDSLLKQWFEALKYPNKESRYWHVLTREITLNEAE